MTIINPNSISGITSFTAEADVMNFYRSNGTLGGLQLNGVNFNTTNGISTFNNLNVGGTITYEDVKNVDSVGIISARTAIHVGAGISAVGIITGTSFRGDGSQLTGITQVGGATTVGFDDDKPIYFGSQDDYKMRWNGTTMYFEPTSSSTTQILHLTSNNQMYIKSKASGLFLMSGNQNVIDIYGGYGGGIYFKNNNTQYLKLEYSNWTFLNNTEVRIPDKLVHAGDENTSIRFPAADTVTVETAGSERIRITSAGLVGIGADNPDCLLHVQGTAISGYGAHANTKLCVEHDGNTAIEIVSSANYLGGIYFSDSGADGVGKIEYYHGTAGNNMRFNTDGSERLRIDSSGNVAIGHTTAWHNYASGATGTSTRLATVHQTGTGWKEMAHFAAGTDSDDTGSVVRISHFGNDRGAYLKAGRGSSDRAIAYFGLRNSSNTDTDILTFRQDSGEYRTITNSEFRFNTPTNAERAIVAFGNHSTSYSLGSSGGAAIRFKNTSGDHSIEFDTHWSGQHHSTAMTLGRSGSLIMRDHRDASIGRDYTTGTLTNGQSVSYNGSGTTLTNGKLNLNSVGGNGGGWIGCLSVSSTDGNPSGAAMIMGVHGQGFNVYNKLLDNFDSGITVTWASGNWSYQISNSSGDTIKYRFTVIHMGTYVTTANGR